MELDKTSKSKLVDVDGKVRPNRRHDNSCERNEDNGLKVDPDKAYFRSKTRHSRCHMSGQNPYQGVARHISSRESRDGVTPKTCQVRIHTKALFDTSTMPTRIRPTLVQ